MIPCSRKWQPIPIFLPGRFHGQRSLAGCSPWGHKELNATEHTVVMLGPACQCRRCKRHRFNIWVRKIPWRRPWQPTPVFLPGIFLNKWNVQGSLTGYSPSGHKEVDVTQASWHTHAWAYVVCGLDWITWIRVQGYINHRWFPRPRHTHPIHPALGFRTWCCLRCGTMSSHVLLHGRCFGVQEGMRVPPSLRGLVRFICYRQ